MPIKIPKTLPARAVLKNENVFVIDDERALRQDIRTLRVAILNLMPTKIATETQLLRLLGNTALQVDVTLLHTATHEARNVDAQHLLDHYETFADVRDLQFDGLIITGAPVEQLAFHDVDYWPELVEIFDWAETNVSASLYICWGAQAALQHRYGIPKYPLPRKMFGVFEHRTLAQDEPLLRGFDDVFHAPHSRHTEIRRADLEKVSTLRILAESDEAGVHIAATRDGRHVFVTGHQEYDPLTLKTGIDIHPGAQIGSGFFIDHGTGVVIGETSVIGKRVRIYQAVTLGAKRFPATETGALQKGLPRHPIVEDDVVIYAGATLLGRIVIGHGSTIGGNVWLTHSVPPHSQITQASSRQDAGEVTVATA